MASVHGVCTFHKSFRLLFVFSKSNVIFFATIFTDSQYSITTVCLNFSVSMMLYYISLPAFLVLMVTASLCRKLNIETESGLETKNHKRLLVI